jgi:hypothetical protein
VQLDPGWALSGASLCLQLRLFSFTQARIGLDRGWQQIFN